MSKLEVAKQMWKAEVEEEEIKLIEKGTPPTAAVIDAITIVSNRRKKKHADKSGG